MRRKDEYLDRLQGVPMFRGLSRKQLDVVARQADPITVAAGSVLVREGDRGEEFFLVLSGTVSVRTDDREMAVLGPGECFGELALFDPAPRDASVVAMEACELLVIDARRFAPLLEDVPMLARRIVAGLAHRLREADRARVLA